ncbi:MAG: methylmalonyl Co-A mutase-associated GTPase MeaB [Myxococcales bacterium]|nr:methylmalonyl Co-A mutase-associated GTPase MeaB [Myxococcales bacterium]
MRWLEDDRPEAVELLKQIFPRTGRAQLIGITGNPGSGKSTLTDKLIAHYRKLGKKVGVVCIDPSSPFTGGAILGDRIRMGSHATDSGVFIRSLATRGAHGGLSRATYDVVNVLDAMGYEVVLIETVGVGQDEIDIVRLAHTNLVVVIPGLGDDIQAIKAGILEIADIFVINKADRPGVERTITDLRYLQSLEPEPTPWTAPILPTVATHGDGIEALTDAILTHSQFLETNDERQKAAQRRQEHVLWALLHDRFHKVLTQQMLRGERLEHYLTDLVNRSVDPHTIVAEIFAALNLPTGKS